MLGTVLQTANRLLPLVGTITDEHGLGGAAKTYKSSAFEVGSFFDNFAKNGLSWAYAIIGLLGVVAIVFAAYNIVTGLISHGKKQVSWPVNIILLLLGGVMAFGGWALFAGTIAAGGAATVENWATT